MSFQSDLFFKPYAPSWVNRLATSFNRSQIPYWVIAFILTVVQSMLLQVIAWIDGTDRYPSVQAIYLLLPIWTWGSIGLIRHLNTVAKSALAKYRDLLDLTDEEFKLLHYQFTNTPVRPVLISNIIFVALFLLFVFVIPFDVVLTWNSLTFSVMVLCGIPMFALGSGFYMHLIHMLIMVDRTYRASKPFNIFDREPIFAFSELTAQSSIALLALATLNLLLIPSSTLDPKILLYEITLVPIGLIMFVMPLWEAHRRLVEDKRKLQSNNDHKLEMTLDQLHQCLETNDNNRMVFLNKAMSSLVIEQDILDKLPTWPWRKGLLTGVASAIFFPTFLLIIQLLIQRWFQP